MGKTAGSEDRIRTAGDSNGTEPERVQQAGQDRVVCGISIQVCAERLAFQRGLSPADLLASMQGLEFVRFNARLCRGF
jgi:hypothetical protein